MDFFRRIFLLSALLAACILHAQSTVPTLTQAIPAQSLGVGGAPVTIDLSNYFTVPGVSGQVAQFTTVLGTFDVELLAGAAPQSVANFLSYVNDGTYNNNGNGTIIHRSVALGGGTANRIIQGGGYDTTGGSITRKAPIPLEYNLANIRGTLAFARGSTTNSATSEWFFNVDDNTTVLGPSNGGGYAVFGRVLGSGMNVVDAIAALPTYNAGGDPFATLPLRDVVAGQQQIQQANFIIVNSIAVVPIQPTASSVGVITYSVANSSTAVVNASLSGTTLTLTPVGAGTANVSIRAANPNSDFAVGAFNVTVGAATSAPAISTQPIAQTVLPGSTVALAVAASGTPTPTYQWQLNGTPISGATGATYVVQNAGTANAGAYSVVITNSFGHVTSAPVNVAVAASNDPGRLSNLSVLTDISSSVPNFTVGTVIGGTGTSGTKSLIVRAAGPALGALGVPNTLADPKLDFYAGAPPSVAANDNWGDDPALKAAMSNVGAFAYPAGSKDAAISLPSLAPRDYTVVVSGAAGQSGLAIAEIYDATAPGTFTATTPRLINVSVLKQIAAGGSLTLGFTVGGSTSKTVLIRAIGPGLAALGVPSPMADPQLTLYNSASVAIAGNDNWSGDAALSATMARVTPSFIISNTASRDAMLMLSLPPGGYTATASGVNGSSGFAIVEVYEVP